MKIFHKDKWPVPIPPTNFLRQSSPSLGTKMIDTSGYQQAPDSKSALKASIFFGFSVPELHCKQESINFDIENCQYEVLEV